MSVLEEAAWTELDIVVNYKPDLKVVLRVGTDNLDPIVSERCLFLQLKDLPKLLRAVTGFEET